MKSVKRLSVLFWVCFIVFTMSNGILIKSLKANETDTVRVGVYQNKPKIYTDEQDRAQGLFIDLIEEMARLENWHLQYVENSWEDNLNALENGIIDIMPDMALTQERLAKFDFNQTPVIHSWSQVYAAPGLNINKLSDLKDLRIAMMEGSVQVDYFNELMQGLAIPFHSTPVKSFKDGFHLVQNDLADAVICNAYFGDMHLHEYKVQKTPVVLNPVSLHFAIKKHTRPHLMAAINYYMDDWKNTPHSHYYATLKKFILPEVQHSEHIFKWWMVVAPLLLISVILFLAMFYRKRIRKRGHAYKEKQKKYKDELNRYKTYFEYIPFGVSIMDYDGNYLEVNKISVEITGLSKEILKTKNLVDLAPPGTENEAVKQLEVLRKEGYASGVYPYKSASGEEKFLEIVITSIPHNRFLGIAGDVTERVRAEKELKELKETLQQQVEEKTRQLQERVKELEYFHEVTIERETRVKELRDEIERLKKGKP